MQVHSIRLAIKSSSLNLAVLNNGKDDDDSDDNNNNDILRY